MEISVQETIMYIKYNSTKGRKQKKIYTQLKCIYVDKSKMIKVYKNIFMLNLLTITIQLCSLAVLMKYFLKENKLTVLSDLVTIYMIICFCSVTL